MSSAATCGRHAEHRVGDRVDDRTSLLVLVVRARAPRGCATARTPGRPRPCSRAVTIAMSMSVITGARPKSAARFIATSPMTARASSADSWAPSVRRSRTRSASEQRVADVRPRASRAACPVGCPRLEVARAIGAPALRRRHVDARREVRLLARDVFEVRGHERVGGHGAVCYSASVARSKPYTNESKSACHEASMMFSLTPIVVHDAVAVRGVDQHAGDRAGSLGRVEHPHLVVGEVDRLERRVAVAERVTQRGVERVHRPVAFRGRDHRVRHRRGP